MSLFGRNNNKKDEAPEPVAPPISLVTPPSPPPPPPPAPVVIVEAPKAVAPPEPPTLSDDKTLNFQAIYQFSRLPETPFTAEQTLAMLEQLPHAMPLEMKRQTVQVTLTSLGTAIGANRDSIVDDAGKKRTTLQQYADAQGKKTNDYVAGAEEEIAELQRKIAQKENEITNAKDKQACIRNLCDTEAARLESVLHFFTDAAPVLPEVTPIVLLNLDQDKDEENKELDSPFLLSDEDSQESKLLIEDSEPLPLRIAA